jgi:hypothetical protein
VVLESRGLRAALKQANPELPLFDAKTMPERVTRSVRERQAASVVPSVRISRIRPANALRYE